MDKESYKNMEFLTIMIEDKEYIAIEKKDFDEIDKTMKKAIPAIKCYDAARLRIARCMQNKKFKKVLPVKD